MKIKIAILTLTLLGTSNVVKSEIYKCEGETGKVTYQDRPCAESEKSTEIKTSAQRDPNAKNSAAVESEPAGQWVNEKDNSFKAYLSVGGSFSMTDKRGDTLSGTWQKNGSNTYSISAKFQGMSFPVNMRYEVSSDTLFLSKAGFPNSFRKYQRQ